MNHPEVAILVLNYNGFETTKKFFDHLYKNTENFRLIIIDNGSTDESLSFLRNQKEIRNNMILYESPKNLGVINGRNKAFDIYNSIENKPDYLCFLDNDQYVQAGWLDQHYSVLNQTNSHIVGVEAWLQNDRFFPIKQCKNPREPWSYIGCGGMLMHKSVTDKIGLFDSQFNPCYFEDPDFCFMAIKSGFRLSWNYKAKIIHIPHQTLGKNPNRMKNFRESLRKFQMKWKRTKVQIMRQESVESLK